MNVCVIVRTRNEEHRVADFCRAYAWADRILVSDGGSEDGTVGVASGFPNVTLRPFGERVELAEGRWRNNDSRHVNFLIACAAEFRPDWVILDDCDCTPNRLLQAHAREILAETDEDFVMAVRLYLWGADRHFPHMAKPGGGHRVWEPSLWAWRGSVDFWTVDVPPAYTFRIGDLAVRDLHVDARVCDVLPPYCLLHRSWDDPERTARKVAWYRDSGFIPGMLHPLDFAGPPEPLPPWAAG